MVNCFVLLLLVTLTTTTTTVFSYTFDPVVSEPNTQFLSNKFNPLSSYLNFRSLERSESVHLEDHGKFLSSCG